MTLWIDCILAGMAVEAMALLTWHRRTGRGVSPRMLLPSLVSGALLLFGMRLALVGAWWGFVSASLLAGGVGHVIDLRQRWRG